MCRRLASQSVRRCVRSPTDSAAATTVCQPCALPMSTEASGVYLAPIAKPAANDKLTKRCLKLVKKATKSKSVRRGVKEVVKAIRKGEKGVCIMAGNISPIDVISHIPVLCEDNGISYIYVPSKEELGAAGSTKRPTSCVLVKSSGEDASHDEDFRKVQKSIVSLQA